MSSEFSKPTKRIRWATQRAPAHKGDRIRHSVVDRFHRRKASEDRKAAGTLDNGEFAKTEADTSVSDQGQAEDKIGRRVFFNLPLPDDVKDENGKPLQQFHRNKIRTAKYTPLTFLPKNLWIQFHNVANVYFLFIVILSVFPIFGAENAALGALPLLFILAVTAVKDAVEDWRRTVLDNELNNTPVHRLVNFNNVNTDDESISLWRRFKKANTRLVLLAWRLWKSRNRRKSKDGKTYAQRAMDETRPSIHTRRSSAFSRQSFDSTRSMQQDGIQMTPVPSPLPGQNYQDAQQQHHRQTSNGTVEYGNTHPNITRHVDPHEPEEQIGKKEYKRASTPIMTRSSGSLINPHRAATGKAAFKKDYWKNLKVGDFVRLFDEEPVPADIIVLATSDPDGACYIETKNLDGETNLKVRQAAHCGRAIKHARDCERAEFAIECESPQANLYSFNGRINWKQKEKKNPDDPGQEMSEPIGINNMLLRGCSLRNTEWALGVVLFTGAESKVMINSGITPSKRAAITQDLNWKVIYNFIILFAMCLVSAIVQGTTWAQGDNSLDFFEFGSFGSTHGLDGFITFWSAIVLFQNLVPISLYITIEIVRGAQAFFIYSDTYMYYDKLDYPCTPKSWNISDDLGQIEYIFSDKTGTLTQNVMEFRKVSVNGVPYGEAYTEALAGMQRRQGIDVDEESARAKAQIDRDRVRMLEGIRKVHDNPYLRDEALTFVAPDFVSDLAGENGEEQKAANREFMLALALCHTVITEKIPGNPPAIEYKAQSPDEAALVSTACHCGFTVLGRAGDEIILNILGREVRYGVLNTLEFNSSRKRMSAIVRLPDGRIMLYCKGADSMIYSRLKPGEQAELRKTTADHLEMFASEGLRTLCVAQRELDEEEYRAWSKEHDEAATALTDRDDKIEHVADAIERNLMLLGGTAIEDRLQDGVPDAIALLGKAGIKLWVLTGDKVETAINIGFSCNLLDSDMELILFKIEDEKLESAARELDKHLAEFGLTGSDRELKAAKKNHSPPAPTHAIVIDGDSLKLVLDDALRQKFLLLCKQCKSVICCRVSPSQKAAVVQMVKTGLDVITLSIGDGANDVAMIQEAQIGVGIAGEEGRQAVMSSDYAIGQFRFLTRLLLVHGRWSYRRLAETIANFFYKNIVWVFALFWYNIFADFDCTYIFDYTYILLYNLAFTSLPVVVMGILDQDVSDKVSLAVPQLYRRGIERKEWTSLKFWGYMFDAFYQGAVVWFLAYPLFEAANFVTYNGLNVNDIRRMGVYVAHPAIVVVNIYILLNVYQWDWVILLVVFISIAAMWFWTGVYTATTTSFMFFEAAAQVYAQPTFYCALFLISIACLLPRFVGKAYQKIFRPRDIDIIREQVRLGKFDYLKDDKPSKESWSSSPTVPEKHRSVSSDSKQLVPKNGAGADSNAYGNTGYGNNYNTSNSIADDERPIYPPSIAPTATTHNPRSQNGSDGTDYISNSGGGGGVAAQPRQSLEYGNMANPRLSMDRPRPSFDRLKRSMHRARPSFEASHDFSSAAFLTKIESSQSGRWSEDRE